VEKKRTRVEETETSSLDDGMSFVFISPTIMGYSEWRHGAPVKRKQRVKPMPRDRKDGREARGTIIRVSPKL
jgi:hypothetical protein